MTTLGTHVEDKQTNKQQQTQHRENDNLGYTRGRQTNKHNTETMTTLGTHAEDKQTNTTQRQRQLWVHTRKTNKQTTTHTTRRQ
jgi:hypothetical protein